MGLQTVYKLRNLQVHVSHVQPADIGWPTGNGKKLSNCQAQLGQATCLAVAYFPYHFLWAIHPIRPVHITQNAYGIYITFDV